TRPSASATKAPAVTKAFTASQSNGPANSSAWVERKYWLAMMLLIGTNCAKKEHGPASSGSKKCWALTSADPCHFARNRVIRHREVGRYHSASSPEGPGFNVRGKLCGMCAGIKLTAHERHATCAHPIGSLSCVRRSHVGAKSALTDLLASQVQVFSPN